LHALPDRHEGLFPVPMGACGREEPDRLLFLIPLYMCLGGVPEHRATCSDESILCRSAACPDQRFDSASKHMAAYWEDMAAHVSIYIFITTLMEQQQKIERQQQQQLNEVKIIIK
jgi:hypothetical protein